MNADLDAFATELYVVVDDILITPPRIVATVGCSDLSLPLCGISADKIDLLFFLSMLDHRACRAADGVGLSHGPNGSAIARPDAVRWGKDATLVEELDRLHAQWLARGRPALGDYRVAFVPAADDAEPPPEGWALDRRFFRELVWLDAPGQAKH